MVFTISEVYDGQFIVQTPNPWGGLYPLLPQHGEEVRSIATCYERIAEYIIEHGGLDELTEIEYRSYQNERNEFRRDRITRDNLTDWNELYTIEFNGSKGWEVVKSFPKTEGIHKVSFEFMKMVVNQDGQYRLTIPS